MNQSFSQSTNSNNSNQIDFQTDIAIIGMSARFPGAANLNEFWQNLVTGSNQIVEIPENRWNLSDFYDANPQAVNKSYSKWGGFLTGIDEFDPLFFNISPKEAELMCPEQRILLQESWKAFEDAGYGDKQLDGKNCGIFIGNSNNNEYKRMLKEAQIPADAYELIGNTSSILAARISYLLNLQGVNIVIDTACSSSLVAIHLACESLRNGTSELALAGGITVFTDSDSYILSSKAGMLSPEGKCKTFDDTADGFVPGEGTGLVVLKPLTTAIKDGDRIYATIKGSGCNQDGKTNGITAPSLLAQTQLESKVYQRFGINPSTIGYVEAHGTGTKLGDPIEIEALTEAFETYTNRKQFCAIGSVKTNIGHTLAASGVAGLIKAALSIQHQKILPTLNCHQENNYIKFAKTPFYVAKSLADWEVSKSQKRRAAISSFGFSGTNAHLVLEEFVSQKIVARREENYPYYLIPISAKTPSALSQKIEDLDLWLETYGDRHELRDIAYTLLIGRSHFCSRCAIVVKNIPELQHELNNLQTNNHSDKYFTYELDEFNSQASKDIQAGNQIIDSLTTENLSLQEFKEKVISLADYYIRDYKLQWQKLYTGFFCPISLPTYPFAKERYWIPQLHNSADIELALPNKFLQPNTPVYLENTSNKALSNELREMKDSTKNKFDLSATKKSEENIRSKLEQDLISLVNQVLKIDPSKIKLNKNIRDYGFDSISLTELSIKIGDKYDLSLMPPILFEHKSLDSFIEFFLIEYHKELVEFYASSVVVSELAQSQSLISHNSQISSNEVSIPSQTYEQDAIAVIGMSGIMPNSSDLETFWQNLWVGEDLISEIPQDRWNWQEIYGDAMSGGNRTKVKWGGFMPEVDKFDSNFFGISRREANLMDPQQRLFLETVWKTIENAGYKASNLAGSKTGLFVGVFSEDYSELLYKSDKAAEAHAVTGLTPSILANRISYLLDLHGPSVPINTACSSSLIALHQAVEAIHTGSCSQAIVGGVNVMVSSTPFIATSKAGMLSEDGRCKTFDQQANGYVRGEGVGAVWLKPLSQALADGDYIHGIIRGTAANHGGAANSLTSPNPEAQADVLVQAYRRAKVDPRRVNYIEAHGTGTSLGDPVEINGIKKAFGQLFAESQLTMPQKPYCGIGTVKSSIGHLEAAAGIAGLIKVLLAMKQGKLHGNIHFQELNPYIQLEDSPFYLVTKNQDWQSLQDNRGRSLPRCAGISSFGFGGANAHAVVEEWLTPPTIVSQSSQPELIILSAKTEERLKSMAANLLQFIDRTSQESAIANYNLANLAYTLQVGRMEMDYRLALVVSDFQDLQRHLQAYCQGNFDNSLVLTGNLKQQKSDEQLFNGLKLNKELLNDLITQQELAKLAKLWLTGVEVDWVFLYSEQKRQRIPLPTYPFIRQRCWFEESEQPKLNQPLVKTDRLSQPSFIKEKLSLSEGEGFTFKFQGDEFFIKDHVIAGNKLLPAAVIVEIARWAGENIFEQKITKITQVTWKKPIAITSNSPTLQIIFTTPKNSQQSKSEFYISLAGSKNSRGRFAAGKIQWTSTASTAESLNLDLINDRCQNIYNVKDIYQQLANQGIKYGESFQGLTKLIGNQKEALGRLEIPASIAHDAKERFYLHPSLLDAAFQTVTGYFNAHKTQPNLLIVPFAVSEIELFASLQDECYAHVLPANKHNHQSGIWTFDIVITDCCGQILIKIKEFNLRTLELNTSSQKVATQVQNHTSLPGIATTTNIHYYSSQWVKRHLPQDDLAITVNSQAVTLVFSLDLDSVNELAISDQENLVVVLAGDSYQQIEPNLFQIRPGNGGDYRQLIIFLQNEQKQINKILHNWCLESNQDKQNPSNWRVNWRKQMSSGIYSVFHLSKALINLLNKQPIQFCLSFHNNYSYPLPQYAALSGLIKSITMECSSISFKLLEFISETPNFDRSLLPTLRLECQSSYYPNRHVRYDAMGRWEREIVPLNLSTSGKKEDIAAKLLLRQSGTYWITGGTGGLGLIVARFLAETYNAKIILSGRKKLNDSIQAELDLLVEVGGNPLYLQANVADKESMVSVVRSIKQQFGSLDGVFHCAGIIRDQFIENKNFREFKSVLKPKVTGVMNLDEVTAKEELDFFIMFSSVTGVTGNPGQADYATGNAFMDHFATVRDQLVQKKLRFGSTISINWPLWAEGGMQVRSEIEKLMVKFSGIETLASENGLKALTTILSSNLSGVIAVTGDKEKIDRFFQVSIDGVNTPSTTTEKKKLEKKKLEPSVVTATPTISAPTEPRKKVDPQERLEKTEAYLIEIFAAILTVSPDEIDSHTPFQEYGIDSFIGLQIVNDLEGEFGTLSKTLLFENFCVRDLANYFVKNYSEHLDIKFGLENCSQTEIIETVPNQIESLESNEEYEGDITNQSPLIFLESELIQYPAYRQQIEDLVNCYGAESNALGRGNFAPYIFLEPNRKGFFYFNQVDQLLLAFGYVGSDEYLETVLKYLETYCEQNELQLNLIEEKRLLNISQNTYSATPFGALQRVTELTNFSLSGSKKRRLRYVISKFQQQGECHTIEYKYNSDPLVDRSIFEMIDHWGSQKVMINPYVDRLKVEIEKGTLDSKYRFFLTYLQGDLQNVIIISPMLSHNGYLMDSEFYGSEMPLGGLEFTIINIIEILKAEGYSLFSLGVTWGSELGDSARSEVKVQKVLENLRDRNIFDGRGNFQFKNKFRPENRLIYLYRPLGSGADNVVDIILTIANSKHPQASATHIQNKSTPDIADRPPVSPQKEFSLSYRTNQLQEQGFNPTNLDAREVEFDLATDSWFLLEQPWIEERLQQLTEKSNLSNGYERFLHHIFPFAYLLPVESGKAAESCFCQAFPQDKKIVLQNLLFPSIIYNEINNSFTPHEIPVAEVYCLNSDDRYRGNIDLQKLQNFLKEQGDEVAFVCVEVGNNAAGGQPVSLENLKKVKALTLSYDVPLIIDATRIVENAVFNAQELELAGNHNIWNFVRQICTYADVLTASLTKDFGVKQGGLIATNNGDLFEQIQACARQDNLELSQSNQIILSTAFQDLPWIETKVKQRIEQVKILSAVFKGCGFPVATPDGGHCILIDVLAIPEFEKLEHPHSSFLAWLYQYAGIRGGIHCKGMGKNPPLDGAVRLAIPIGLSFSQLEEIAARVEQLNFSTNPIPQLVIVSKPSTIGGEAKAEFELQPSESLKSPIEPQSESKVTDKPLATEAERKSLIDSQRVSSKDIAIVGVSGRYPMADNIEEFWDNLAAGKNCITERPLGRWGEKLPKDNEKVPKTRWGGFVNNIDKFDSIFFGISPREAELLDPQERLFLEVAWESLEDGGYYPDSLAEDQDNRNIGVFVGAVWQLYQMLGVEEIQKGNVQTPNSLMWNIANRVSSFMDFNGPSLTVDTACSGALAAIHLACQSICNGECQAAITGGVNLDLHALKWLLTKEGGFLSDHGRCKAFGEDAQGYVAGEGVGALLLKPLEQAVADGDRIYAVIKNSVFNHGGRASGYTVPNPNAQADLIASAIREADIDARTIGCIEAHGTGTKLGDPIEIQGLTQAFRESTAAKQFCSLGSVKSNIGHLEAAAGIAGLTKVLLQLKHKKLVPSLHASNPNSFIDFANSPFYIQQQLSDWQPITIDGVTYPRRAGVSSFGAGGSNLHIILEEYQNPNNAQPQKGDDHREELILLSARNEEQLRDYANRVQQFLNKDISQESSQQEQLQDIAFTLQVGRKPMRKRLAIIADSKEILLDKLNCFLANKEEIEGLFIGDIKNSQKVNNISDADIAIWVQSHNYHQLANNWTKGLTKNLTSFMNEAKGKRISLPTYPFAKVRHWLTIVEKQKVSPKFPLETYNQSLHPLVDSNESTLEKVSFQKLINPQQYLFRDHVVAGYPTLPGVAYIEMGCVAGTVATQKSVNTIKNLVWAAPINLESPPQIHIEVKPSNKDVRFEVCTVKSSSQKVVHAQGKLGCEDLSQPQPLDLEAILQRCLNFTSKHKCYEMLGSLKFNYGTCLQAIAGVQHNQAEGLTKLVLPEPLHEDFSSYHLHPSLMDGAVQSIIAVMQNESGYMKTPYLPFVVGKVEIFQPLTPVCYSHTTIRKGNRDVNTIKKANITIVDEQGEVLVKMNDFALKSFNLDDLDANLIDRQDDDFNLSSNGFKSLTTRELPSRIYVSSVWEEAPV